MGPKEANKSVMRFATCLLALVHCHSHVMPDGPSGVEVNPIAIGFNNRVGAGKPIVEAKLRIGAPEAKLEALTTGIEAFKNKIQGVEGSFLRKRNVLNWMERFLAPELATTSIITQILNGTGDTGGGLYTGVNFTETITSILGVTRGRLHTGVNYTGYVYDYDLADSSNQRYIGFLRLPRRDFKSVDTHNGCIRLFSEEITCHGLSLAIYPGSDNGQNFMDPNLTGFLSLGPCLPNEFELSTLSTDGIGGVRISKSRNNTEGIPDQALIGGFWKYGRGAKIVYSTKNPVITYRFDSSQSRIIYLGARIFKRHLLNQTAEVSRMKGSSVWRSFDKREGDDLGFVIPPSMGGPANEAYNIFPQSPRNKLEWSKYLGQAYSFVVSDGESEYFRIHVNFAYLNESTNRPLGIYLHGYINRSGMKSRVIYRFFKN